MAYFSKKYIPAKKNYAPHDNKLLVIFKANQKWRCYLDRHQTMVFTDYKVLIKL